MPAQNIWLEMFDKAMSERHQMDYLQRQIQEQQAARAERASQFQQQMQANAADREMHRVQQEQQAQLAIAQLLGGGAAEAGADEKGDITLGGRQFNLPSPFYAGQVKQFFEKQAEDEDFAAIQDIVKDLPNPMERARILAEVKARRNIIGNQDIVGQYAEWAMLAEDMEQPEKTRQYATRMRDAYGEMLGKRYAGSGRTAGAMTATQVDKIKLQQAIGKVRQALEMFKFNPTDPLYGSMMSQAVDTVMKQPQIMKDIPEGMRDRVRSILLAAYQRPGRQAGEDIGALIQRLTAASIEE